MPVFRILARRAGPLLLCLVPAWTAAAGASSAAPGVSVQADLGAIAAQRHALQQQNSASRAGAKATPVAAPGSQNAAELFANPVRAYPPSCLNSPLALGLYLNDAHRQQATVNLIGDPYSGNAAEQGYLEADVVTVWRVVCSKTTNASNQTVYQSATLLEIDRPANLNNTTPYPTTPGVSVHQGDTTLNVRFADDPNTFFSTTYPITPLVSSDVFVLENFYSDSSPQFDYNQAFTLTIDTFNSADPNRFTTFNVPAYNPANYADSSLALPIGGYQSTNWYDPAHSGEGMLVQVYDNNDGATRTFTAAWYTFDHLGLPFWLYAQGSIAIGARSSGDVDTYYATGGGFAGSVAGPATFTKWGTINVSFPDCNHMNFSYNGQTDAQTNGPGGSGSRSGWIRLANINSLTCD